MTSCSAIRWRRFPALPFSARSWRDQAPLADHIFHNDGTVAAFEAEIEAVFAATVENFRAGTLPPPRWLSAAPLASPPTRQGTAR